ncbi:MAG TPA: radical SAM family heme chaperone HemW [Candidatus Limnocylindrales bacterium]|nr:radical SAM family heme chaperone HemW [Candidatus Limnocylindrales bacterium]
MHVPFCGQRCGYCSFNTAPYLEAAVPRYLAAVLAEIDRVADAPWAPGRALATIFLGGGTPSLLSPAELDAILGRLRARFTVPGGVEITVECNPESVSRERLAGYRAAGVSRISLGVQSLDDRILPGLDRLHTAAAARAAFEAARTAGFDNVSVDLIYGLPGLDLSTWERTVREILAWEPDHLSAYGLTLDEGSLWHAAGTVRVPPEDTVTAQYRLLARLARDAGFEHYEISNYARPHHRSAHNQVYWHAEEYLGLGPGACGFLGAVRYGNVKPVDRYCARLEAGELPVATEETLTARQMLAERLILGLRMADGVPDAWLDERLDLERGRLPAVLEAWQERGLLVRGDGRARLTEEGFLLSDALFTEFL